MFRGICKVAAIAFVTNQLLTTILTYVAQQLDLGLAHEAIWLFSCVTGALLTFWLLSDARRAFGFACEKRFVKKSRDGSQNLQIAENCPKRWLVILHIELNPATMQA